MAIHPNSSAFISRVVHPEIFRNHLCRSAHKSKTHIYLYINLLRIYRRSMVPSTFPKYPIQCIHIWKFPVGRKTGPVGSDKKEHYEIATGILFIIIWRGIFKSKHVYFLFTDGFNGTTYCFCYRWYFYLEWRFILANLVYVLSIFYGWLNWIMKDLWNCSK